MATIHVDGKTYEVEGADNLLHACLSLGLDIPYFCWHPSMGSVGACRQCAVKQFKDADDSRGKIVMSCMTPATEGTFISIDDEEAKKFRGSVIEWLMTNHPHDCPVCEEGGHCHLQDMTVMTGHSARHYRFTKRTHLNQDLGPFIGHEMNRCIACYRCVRYYSDYADGRDFGVFGAAANVYFGRQTDGTLESEFSGNLTEVCPTGVFTDRTYGEHYTRKWDMQFAPSICSACSLGCSVSPGERYGEVRRIENRYHGSVNHYFLCDRGRFGYGFANREDRPRLTALKPNGVLQPTESEAALTSVGGLVRSAQRLIGIGSPRASLESNYALRELVGQENFFDGHSSAERALVARAVQILREGPAHSATLTGIEKADAAVVLGEDLTQTAPRAALALRQAARNIGVQIAEEMGLFPWHTAAVQSVTQDRKNPIHLTALCETRLDDIAASIYRGSPEDQARIGHAVAHVIDETAPNPVDLDQKEKETAAQIAGDLLTAKQPLIVAGTYSGQVELLEAAANIAWALHRRGKPAELFFVLPEANSFGSSLLGGKDLSEAMNALTKGDADVAIVLENDIYRRIPQETADVALKSARVVVLDHQDTRTTKHAEIFFPAATVFEGDGTYVNNEGRAQRFFQVFDPAYYNSEITIDESWCWLRKIRSYAKSDGKDNSTLDDLIKSCASELPVFQGLTKVAPAASFRINGLRVAREPHRYSGRTAMRANLSVHEPRAPQDKDSALSYSMEGHHGFEAGQQPAALIPYAWAPGWNSPQSWNKFQDEVGGHLRGGDPGVRLFEPAANATCDYFKGIPEPCRVAKDGVFRVARLPQIYGTEELSALSPAVGGRIAPPFLGLSPADAAHLGLSEGDAAAVVLSGVSLQLPVRLIDSIPEGMAGLPDGSKNIPCFLDKQQVEIAKAAQA